MSGEHKPGTLFERHPKPWKMVSGWVYDANDQLIADDDPFGSSPSRKLVDLINADAPKPFVPGWYWLRLGAAASLPALLSDEDAQRRHVVAGYVIGPRIEPPAGFDQ